MSEPHTNDTNDTNVPAAVNAVETADHKRAMTLSEAKALFAGMDAAAEEQARAAEARLVQAETEQSIQFVVQVLLPRLVEARANGQWFVGLQDSLAPASTSTSATASPPVVIRTPSLATVVGVLLDVLPPSWVLRLVSASEAELLRLPAVNDRVWAETRNQVVRCRVVERSPAGIDLLTVEWPWKKTERLRFEFRSGVARGSSKAEMSPQSQSPVASSSAAALTVTVDAGLQVWQTFKSLIPSPEQAEYDPRRCFSAALQVAQGAVDMNDKVARLRFLLRDRPFVVKDPAGANYAAVLMDVKGDGVTLQSTEALFHFAGYDSCEDRWLNLDSSDIRASLPHRPTGLGQFMLAMAPTANVLHTISTDPVRIVEHEPDVDGHVMRTAHRPAPGDQPLVFWVTATTYAVPCCGPLKANLAYPVVCGMNRFALQKMFGEQQLYTFCE